MTARAWDDALLEHGVVDVAPLERERAEADLREWEAELFWDGLRRDDPCRPPEERKAA